MKKLVRLLFIASFAFSAHHANAQETGADEPQLYQPIVDENAPEPDALEPEEYYEEISLSFGQISYANPELWNNNGFYSLAWRYANHFKSTFIDLEIAVTETQLSSVDGLTRRSNYEKLGYGIIFNKGNTATAFFSEFGLGFIKTKHYVHGSTTWRAPESDEKYEHQVTYENAGPLLSSFYGNIYNAGFYFHAAFGIKIKNRHKLSFYIHPIYEGPLAVRSSTDSELRHNNEQENTSYYYGEIPDKIVEGMAGFRYSYIFGNEE